MAPKIPPQVLLSLGLTSGCQKCGETHMGVCLEAPMGTPHDNMEASGNAGDNGGEGSSDGGDTDEYLGPCLLVLPNPDWDTDNRAFDDDRIHLGPCLKVAPPREDGPPPPPSPPSPAPAPESDDPSQPASDQGNTADEARSRVLARGVLPADVAALLERILG